MKIIIDKYIDENFDWLKNNLKLLIREKSINIPPKGLEDNAQKIIENIFISLGLNIDKFSPDNVKDFKDSEAYLKGRDYNNRHNIIGYIGDDRGKILIFNGHIDTVPSNEFNWRKTKPFSPLIEGNKMYGLGSGDMKGGLITTIFALKSIIDLGIKIKGKVIIQSVVDEEFGGGNGTISCIKMGYVGDFAIIPEPTFMDLEISNISSEVLIFNIKGDEGINYIEKNKEAINPIIVCGELITILREFENYLNSLKKEYNLYKDIKKPINFLFSDINAGENRIDKVITNPSLCTLRVYLMNYPEKSKEEFENQLMNFIKKYPNIYKYFEDSHIEYFTLNRFIEGMNFNLNTDENKKFIEIIQNNSREVLNKPLNKSAFLSGSDAFAFPKFGKTNAILLGPGGGNFHAADEFVYLDDLKNLSKIFARLIFDLCC